MSEIICKDGRSEAKTERSFSNNETKKNAMNHFDEREKYDVREEIFEEKFETKYYATV
jgi:hypothetical protein